MKRKLINDYLLRQFLKNKQLKDVSLKVLIRLGYTNYLETLELLSKVKKNKSFTKVHNRCFITSRGHSINRYSSVSRIKLRELGKNGLILGLKKFSW